MFIWWCGKNSGIFKLYIMFILRRDEHADKQKDRKIERRGKWKKEKEEREIKKMKKKQRRGKGGEETR